MLTATDPRVGREAVRKVARHLYDPRGESITQFELGPDSTPQMGEAIFAE